MRRYHDMAVCLALLVSALAGPSRVQAADAAAATADGPAAWMTAAEDALRAHDDARAQTLLARVLTADPRSIAAHVWLGDLAFRRDALGEALEHYQAAARLDPNDVEVRDRLDVIAAYRQADAGFSRLFSAHFLVKYHAGDHTLAVSVSERLESIFETVGRTLQYRPDRPITVMLHSDATFTRLTGSPPWAHGLFDGKIHLAAEALRRTPDKLSQALAHEYAHAVVHRISGGRTPTWLSEGIALELAGGPVAVVSEQEWAHMAPLHALHGSFLGLDRRDAAIAYAESRGAVHLLVQRHGWLGLRHLLETLNQTPDFSTAFEQTFREPYREFERRWTASRPRASRIAPAMQEHG